jgi:hypothetical protein
VLRVFADWHEEATMAKSDRIVMRLEAEMSAKLRQKAGSNGLDDARLKPLPREHRRSSSGGR